MKLAIQYHDPDGGQILYRGQPLQSYSPEAFPISYIPSFPVFFEELTLSEHLAFLSAIYGTQKKVDFYIDRFELAPHLNKVTSKLSQGTKQKLSIVCALLRNYELLIADEPFVGLDPQQIFVLKDLLKQLKSEGKSIFISSHLLNVVGDICDTYLFLDNGRCVAHGNVDRDNFASLEKTYLDMFGRRLGTLDGQGRQYEAERREIGVGHNE